jgi:hypothetical protein
VAKDRKKSSAKGKRRRDGEAKQDQERSIARPFRPTAKMQAYLLKWREFQANGRRISQKAVAHEAGVDESVVSRWHRIDGFDAWWGDELLGEARRRYPNAVLSGMCRAERTGDPKEIAEMGRITGQLPAGYVTVPDVPVSGSGGGFTLNLLVPRPDAPVPPKDARDGR